jgi:two-component system response regulator
MPDDATPDFASRSFLIVDDAPAIRTLLARILGEMGATDVATASDGKQALAHLDAAEAQPEVLFIDLTMPEMGGVKLMQHLATRGYESAVVLVSSADEETLTAAEGWPGTGKSTSSAT